MSRYFVYVLKSQKDDKLYVGFTSDLKKRIKTHNDGKVLATRGRRPLTVVYYELFRNCSEAIGREKYFKSGSGREYIARRIAKISPYSSIG